MWLPLLVSTNHALLLSPLHHSWRFSIPHSCRHDAFHSSPSLREGSLLHAASSAFAFLIDLFNILSSSSHHPMSMFRSPLFDLLPPSPPFRITPVSRSLYLLIVPRSDIACIASSPWLLAAVPQSRNLVQRLLCTRIPRRIEDQPLVSSLEAQQEQRILADRSSLTDGANRSNTVRTASYTCLPKLRVTFNRRFGTCERAINVSTPAASCEDSSRSASSVESTPRAWVGDVCVSPDLVSLLFFTLP